MPVVQPSSLIPILLKFFRWMAIQRGAFKRIILLVVFLMAELARVRLLSPRALLPLWAL
jgi:hypothetical protein